MKKEFLENERILKNLYSYVGSNLPKLARTNQFFNKSIKGYVQEEISELLVNSLNYFPHKKKYYHDHIFLKVLNIYANAEEPLYYKAILELEKMLTNYTNKLDNLL